MDQNNGFIPAKCGCTWEIVNKIDKGGAAGPVYKAVAQRLCRTCASAHIPKTVAVKLVPRDDPAYELERDGSRLLLAVRHPHVIAIYFVTDCVAPGDFLDRQGDVEALAVGMELADNSLKRWLEPGQARISVRELRRYIRQAAAGVDHLSLQRHPAPEGRDVFICHRDIKPANLLLTGGVVKVGDFTIVRPTEHSRTSTAGRGTKGYTAPEVLEGDLWRRGSDVYSLAASYGALRIGQDFGGWNRDQVLRRLQGALQGKAPKEWPVLEKALSEEPKERYFSCQDFCDALDYAYPVFDAPLPYPVRELLRENASTLQALTKEAHTKCGQYGKTFKDFIEKSGGSFPPPWCKGVAGHLGPLLKEKSAKLRNFAFEVSGIYRALPAASLAKLKDQLAQLQTALDNLPEDSAAPAPACVGQAIEAAERVVNRLEKMLKRKES